MLNQITSFITLEVVTKPPRVYIYSKVDLQDFLSNWKFECMCKTSYQIESLNVCTQEVPTHYNKT